MPSCFSSFLGCGFGSKPAIESYLFSPERALADEGISLEEWLLQTPQYIPHDTRTTSCDASNVGSSKMGVTDYLGQSLKINNINMADYNRELEDYSTESIYRKDKQGKRVSFALNLIEIDDYGHRSQGQTSVHLDSCECTTGRIEDTPVQKPLKSALKKAEKRYSSEPRTPQENLVHEIPKVVDTKVACKGKIQIVASDTNTSQNILKAENANQNHMKDSQIHTDCTKQDISHCVKYIANVASSTGASAVRVTKSCMSLEDDSKCENISETDSGYTDANSPQGGHKIQEPLVILTHENNCSGPTSDSSSSATKELLKSYSPISEHAKDNTSEPSAVSTPQSGVKGITNEPMVSPISQNESVESQEGSEIKEDTGYSESYLCSLENTLSSSWSFPTKHLQRKAKTTYPCRHALVTFPISTALLNRNDLLPINQQKETELIVDYENLAFYQPPPPVPPPRLKGNQSDSAVSSDYEYVECEPNPIRLSPGTTHTGSITNKSNTVFSSDYEEMEAYQPTHIPGHTLKQSNMVLFSNHVPVKIKQYSNHPYNMQKVSSTCTSQSGIKSSDCEAEGSQEHIHIYQDIHEVKNRSDIENVELNQPPPLPPRNKHRNHNGIEISHTNRFEDFGTLPPLPPRNVKPLGDNEESMYMDMSGYIGAPFVRRYKTTSDVGMNSMKDNARKDNKENCGNKDFSGDVCSDNSSIASCKYNSRKDFVRTGNHSGNMCSVHATLKSNCSIGNSKNKCMKSSDDHIIKHPQHCVKHVVHVKHGDTPGMFFC